MNLTQLIQTRRTIHRFKPDPIDQQIVYHALSLMQYMPNHHLTQPWRFYLIGMNTKNALLDYANHIFQQKNASTAQQKIEKWREIPGWIMVTQQITSIDKQEEDYAAISCGLYAIMLFLHEQGIGTKWSTSHLITTPAWYEICNISMKNERIIGLLWYGYPQAISKMSPRLSPDHYIFER